MNLIAWKRTACLAVACLGLTLGNAAMAQSSSRVATLRADTPVVLTAENDISSANVTVGDTASFILASDLMVGDAIAVKRGTKVLAKVTLVVKAKAPGRSGALSLRLEPLHGVSKNIPLRANLNGGDNDDVHYERSYHLKWPMGLFRTGDDVVIHSGDSLTVFVATDVQLPALD
jgi:hypothetical protein